MYIVLYHPEKETNIGTVMRNAFNFGCIGVIFIGRKYQRQQSDTVNASKHLYICNYRCWDEFLRSSHAQRPNIAVELLEESEDIRYFEHPKCANYIFGPESSSLGKNVTKYCQSKIIVPTKYCMNLAVATGVVMYDRMLKTTYANVT